MERGEVWWANLLSPSGRRPVVLLTRTAAYQARTSATVAPITRTIRGIQVEVLVDETDGMPGQCVVNLDDITTIPISLLDRYITTLSAERLRQVEHAIMLALDLPTAST